MTLKTDGVLIAVPSQFAGVEAAYRTGYRAGRQIEGGYRLNMEAMRYEPSTPLGAPELHAWTEGFRAGFVDRRAAGEPLRY